MSYEIERLQQRVMGRELIWLPVCAQLSCNLRSA